MLTGQTGHIHAIGTLDLRDDTVGRDSGGNSSDEAERVTHIDGCASGGGGGGWKDYKRLWMG